jgi:excisionase family DNA binding protein
MPRSKTGTATPAGGAPPAVADTPVAPAGSDEVLTLAEATAYLRLSEGDVLRLVREQNLPGRQIGDQWRFLKAAIQDWLRSGPPPRGSKEAIMALAGVWKDDPTVDEMLREIYKRRGRPMTEEGE